MTSATTSPDCTGQHVARNESRAKTPAAVRRAQAVQLRLAGRSFREIGAELGVTVSTAFALTEKGLRDWAQPDADQLFLEVMAQLDQLHARYWPDALKGNLDAFGAVMRIIDRKVRLVGLDAPKRVDIRAVVERWAEAEGFDPDDVLAVTAPVLRELERG